MLERGLLYLVVFAASVLVCALSRSRALRRWTLLLASLALYASWSWRFTSVLLLSALANFTLGRSLKKHAVLPLLAVGLVLNTALLALLKYLPELAPGFISQNWMHLIVLPIGLSFWTFQALSYLFDQYRGEELDPTLPEFLLYMSFFPVAISGPICRLPDLLPQFRASERTPSSWIESGLQRMATGVCMLLAAKILAQGVFSGDGVDSGFDRVQNLSGPDVWVLVLGFGLQLFLNFAGYSHLAIGAAQCLNIVAPENFDRPFSATTPSAFWTKWHMSLSFWIRDYVFIPFATARREKWWRYVVLAGSMVLFGLWHHATWLFFLWGLYHGTLLVGHRLVQRPPSHAQGPNPLSTLASRALTLCLISLGWIFFRAPSPARAKQMWSALFSPATYTSQSLTPNFYALVIGVAFVYAVCVRLTDSLRQDADRESGIMRVASQYQRFWLPSVYVLTILFLLAITSDQGSAAVEFLYQAF